MIRLLLLEDERDLREEMSQFFVDQGFAVTEADSIRSFWEAFRLQGCDIAILDRMLPDGDGVDVVRELRDSGQACGVILYTARDTSEEQIDGYRVGADHYLTKPIRLDQLDAVVQSLARRLTVTPDWSLDTVHWKLLTPDNVLLDLTGQQAVFLATLSQARGRVVSRRDLVRALGKDFSSYDPRNLDALVKRLRQKVDACGAHPLPVKTRHGAGYQMTLPLRLTGAEPAR